MPQLGRRKIPAGTTLEVCPLAASAEAIGWGVAAWLPPRPPAVSLAVAPRLAGAAEGNGEKLLLCGPDNELLAVTLTREI